MSNAITFIKKPVVETFYPPNGLGGIGFIITGQNLEDAEHVYFIDAFENKVEVPFNKVLEQSGATKLTGIVPVLDGTLGVRMVRVENSVGYSDKCCFSPLVSTQTSIANISGDDVIQIDDKYAINAEISDTPTNTQGFEVLTLTYTPVSPSTKLVIESHLSLQSNFWGSAVVALFKNNEATPKKVWSYALMGINFGQVAKLGVIEDSSSLTPQTWRVRVGRTHNTYPTIYINRSVESATPYGGATSSWMSITEIDG